MKNDLCSQRSSAPRQRVPFAAYVERRLGAGSWARQAWRVLVQPFSAGSISEFWRLWNPVWSWCLREWVYRPVSRVAPRWTAILTTFTVSGGVHNAIAIALSRHASYFTMVWFVALGVITVVSEAVNLRLDRLPPPLRAVVICGHLAVGYQVAEFIRL